MWTRKEINVSHIISVCLVVIARKRENILSRQKLLQVAFSETGGAFVQQQKSSADVQTAINVTNMTLVFLLEAMMMSMTTNRDASNNLFRLAVD